MKKISILLLMFFVLTVNIFPQSIDSKISQSIMGANTISVTVGGNFIVTGTFPAFINDRVDQFVTRLYNNSKEALLSEATAAYMRKALEKDFAKYSFRNITLKRASGEEFKLDLLKFRKTGDFKNNPYLKNDDVLIFPTTDLERNFFTVSGAVNAPGKFHFMEGDKLKDAIELAEGINKAYEKVQFAEINRLSYDGERIEVVKVSIDENVALQRGDRIVVVANETQRKEFSVTVIGEVNIPGTIPITKNNSTLKEVFERAGGLKENASLNRVKLYDNSIFNFLAYRENTEDLLEKSSTSYNENIGKLLLDLEKFSMLRMSNVTIEDTSYFFLENQLRVYNEGASLNLTDMNEPNSEIANYKVKDGDIIVVPAKITTIEVFGQVSNPGNIPFEEGKDYKYYIEKAGGFGEYSIEDEVMVIKGASREWISPIEKTVKLEEGDYIYVPREKTRSFNEYVQSIGGYLGIAASAATIILLLIQFGK